MKDPEIASEASKPARSHRGGVWAIAIIALFVSLLSLAAPYYLWQLQQQWVARLNSANQSLAQMTNRQLNDLNTKIESQQKMLHSLVSLSHEQEKKTTLLLAQEAEHLLTLAQYTLLFESNSDLATKLVLNADQKLQEAEDTTLASVRKDLANVIITLNATPKVDVTGIVARINAISDQVGNLSVIPSVAPRAKQKEVLEEKLSWKDKFLAALQQMQGFITIRRLQEPVQPLATPEQHLYLLETIRLQLAQAQWAVLHQQPDIYQHSLEKAKENVSKYYSTTSVGIRLVSMINELQQINIKPPVPNLTPILTQLRNAMTSLQSSRPNPPLVTKPNESLPPPQSGNAPIPTAVPS